MKPWKNTTVALIKRLLPERARDAMLHVAFHVSPEEFRRFAYLYAHAPAMDHGLAALARRGFRPATVIDVGAYRGDWTRMAHAIWPHARLIMVEPNRENHASLNAAAQALGAQIVPELLGAEDGREVEFFVMSTGSSVLSERSPLPREVERRVLRRLDSAVAGVQGPVLLKIDAQGYELEILRGAAGLLESIHAVLLEVAVIEINEGAPLLDEVVAYMRAIGFVTYDLMEIHRRPLDGALNQVDVLFVRQDSSLIADKRHFAS